MSGSLVGSLTTSPHRRTAMPAIIGTSGWQYRHWRDVFYPRKVRQADWLAYYAERFSTVEINATFYRLPNPERFDEWAQTVPEGFTFAVKASQYLTHRKRLKDPQEPVATLLERARRLGGMLGPVLVQLPPNFKADAERLDAALAAFPDGVRVAVEPRHDSWWTDEVAGALAEHDAALVWADDGSQWQQPTWATAGWGYVRLHGGTGSPPSGYGRTRLQRVAGELAETWSARQPVYVYFNNDAHGCAVRDARMLARELADTALEPTRVPAAEEVDLEAASAG
jgi:uncharacterized protein YecE (DUF72 family)